MFFSFKNTVCSSENNRTEKNTFPENSMLFKGSRECRPINKFINKP